MKNSKFALLLALSLCPAAGAFCQSYRLESSAIAGGGGSSAGGAYALSSVLARSAGANSATGGPYTAISGLGALYVLQSANAPLVTIRRTATNTFLISWPSPSSGWTLQQNTNLAAGTWTAPPESVADNGGTKSINVSRAIDRRFFRLAK